MIKRMLRLVAVKDEPSRKLRMSRELRQAVRDLTHFALEEEMRKSISRDIHQNPTIHKAWGL